jgi:RHS repeat-associated protein
LTSEINNGIESYYAYNKLSQVTAHENQHNGDRLYREEFEYNSDGNQKSKTEIGINDEVAKVTNYTYDNANHLKSETTACHSGLEPESTETFGMYEYDEYGNRKQQYTLDFLMDTSTGTYNYNLLGQFTGSEIEKEGETTTFAYEYNPNGTRKSKTVDGVTTKYIWDGQNIAAEMDENGSVTAKYLRGLHLTAMQTGSITGYYNHNAHGDVISLTDASGKVENSYTYDAWGNERNTTETIQQPFRYSGEYYDGETDLYYLRNRYYDPKVGRFTQEDPIRSGQNWYVYCGNNPVNRWDPTGYAWTDEDQAEYDRMVNAGQKKEAKAFKKEINAATKDWDNAGDDIILQNDARYRAVVARQGVYANGYADDFDYMRSNEVMGIFVTHSVLKYGNHAGIAIMVGADSDLYTNATNTRWGEKVRYLTLGAQEVNGNSTGIIIAINNRGDDANFSKKGAHINLNVSKLQADSLISRDSYFITNCNNRFNYNFNPNGTDNWNSNSYAWSLSRHSGVNPPNAQPNGWWFPGWDKPMPNWMFIP